MDVMAGQCDFNDTRAGMLLVENPFGTKHSYDPLNTTLYLNNITSSKYFEYLKQSYGIEISQTQAELKNYIGNGQIYNLPESKIFLGNNISIELSSVSLELKKL